MNCFLLLAAYLCVRVQGQNFDQQSRLMGGGQLRQVVDILGSVREFPSQLHRCTASFIRPNVLLTTARCLICLDDCKYFVHPLISHLLNQNYTVGPSYTVKSISIHPEYERNPQQNDIGIIKLNASVPGATIFLLPKTYNDKNGIPVGTYTWQFSPNLQEYHLAKRMGTTISNAMCSLLHNRYIDFRQICMRQIPPSTLGSFDQGAPLVQYDKGVGIMTGIYVREENPRTKKVEIFQSLYPLLSWIKLLSLEVSPPEADAEPSTNQAPASGDDASEESAEEMRFSSDLADAPEDDEMLNRALPNAPAADKATESPETSGNTTADTSDDPKNVKWSPEVPPGRVKKALHPRT